MRNIAISMMLLGLACAIPTMAQSVEEEKSFIKENMEFAAQQYGLMMKTPAQGKEGKGVMPHSMRKDGSFYHIAMYAPKTGDPIPSSTTWLRIRFARTCPWSGVPVRRTPRAGIMR